jgi:hypothetical protein
LSALDDAGANDTIANVHATAALDDDNDTRTTANDDGARYTASRVNTGCVGLVLRGATRKYDNDNVRVH